jgi:hypothetical protein
MELPVPNANPSINVLPKEGCSIFTVGAFKIGFAAGGGTYLGGGGENFGGGGLE